MAKVIQYGTTIRVLEANANQVSNTVFLLTEDAPLPPQPPSPEGSFTVMLYKNSSENERVDKTDYLTAVESVMCVLRDECSIINPELILTLNRVPDFNYVYIPVFRRYYYVTNFVSMRKDLWSISLDIDVLMTYKEGIYNLQAFVERNQFNSNPLLVDKKRVVEEGINVETYSIDNMLLSNTFIQPNTDVMYVLNGYKIDSADRIGI